MGRGRSLLSANPDNAAPGSATGARCGGRGGRTGEKQIRAPSNPYSSFSSSSYPLCIRRGFDKKFCFQQCHTIINYEKFNTSKLEPRKISGWCTFHVVSSSILKKSKINKSSNTLKYTYCSSRAIVGKGKKIFLKHSSLRIIELMFCSLTLDNLVKRILYLTRFLML